ncbi:MAG: sulfatase-like hydrolase/transferase [bacterium]
MPRLRYCCAVAALLILIFELIRMALLIRYAPLAQGIPPGVLLKSFLVGLRFDLTVTGYIIAPVALFGMLPWIGWSSSRVMRWIGRTWMIVFGSIAMFAGIVDMEFFGQFNSRLNHIVFGWTDTPLLSLKIVWEAAPIVPYVVAWMILAGFFAYALIKLERLLDSPRREPLWRSGGIYLLVLATLLLMIRGRISEKAPINWSVAYFSGYNFANQLALNSAYTFVQDAIIDQDERNEANVLGDLMPAEDSLERTRRILGIEDSLFVMKSPIARLERDGPIHRYNVVLIICESLASVFIRSQGGVEDLGPELERIAANSVLFSNFFSSGSHTFTGIFSTVTGYPSPLGQSLMKRSEGQQDFGGLASVLQQRGYTCWFYVPHDPHFDNMQGFLHLNGYSRVIGQPDFPANEVLSTLGVPDHVMFNRALEDMQSLPQPFLVTLLTSTNHGPFRIPEGVPSPRVPPGTQHEKRFNATLYADWALGRFVDQVDASSWGDSTIIVILGDHGVNWNPKVSIDPSLFHVPLVLHGPGLLQPEILDPVGGQVDVTASVMDLLGGEWINASYGSSLFRPGHHRALIVKDVEEGLIEGDRFLIRNRDGSTNLFSYPGLEHIENEDNVMDRLRVEARAMLSSTHHLVSLRLVGDPKRKK